jgi:hypothetical protein
MALLSSWPFLVSCTAHCVVSQIMTDEPAQSAERREILEIGWNARYGNTLEYEDGTTGLKTV